MFDKDAIVIDPQVPESAQRKLRSEIGRTGKLIPFWEPTSPAPEPPRPRSARPARRRVPSRDARTRAETQAYDPAEWPIAHAEKIFHRRYVVPRTDIDNDGMLVWNRAITAVNSIYAAEVMRSGVIDSVQATAAVPEQLWKIAEGLARITEIRLRHEKILRRVERSSVIAAKVARQEDQLVRAAEQVSDRLRRLEELAVLLGKADAARQRLSALEQLGQVDNLLRDLLAGTANSASDLDVTEFFQREARAVIEQAREAIREANQAGQLLAVPEDDETEA